MAERSGIGLDTRRRLEKGVPSGSIKHRARRSTNSFGGHLQIGNCGCQSRIAAAMWPRARPPDQKQELILFLAARLRAGSSQLLTPREFGMPIDHVARIRKRH